MIKPGKWATFLSLVIRHRPNIQKGDKPPKETGNPIPFTQDNLEDSGEDTARSLFLAVDEGRSPDKDGHPYRFDQ